MDESHITPDKKIDILLKEYDTLRTEIIHRTGQRFSFISLLGTVSGYVLFKEKTPTFFQLMLILVAIVFLILVWLRFGKLITECSVRISEIETKINSLVGEELLVWESRNRRNLFFHMFYRRHLSPGSENKKTNSSGE